MLAEQYSMKLGFGSPGRSGAAPQEAALGWDSEAELIDGIYAAVVDPGRWASVIESVADEIGALQACLTRLNHADGDGEGIEARIDPSFVQAYYDYYRTRNVFTVVDDFAAWRKGWRPTVVGTADMMPLEDYHRSEYFNDFMRPQDAGATLHVRLELTDTTSGAIAFGRAIAKGEFTSDAVATANRLQPHLVRAYRLGRMIAGRPGVGGDLQAVLETTSQAVLLVDGDGTLRHANPAAERLLGRGDGGLVVRQGRLSAQHPAGARRLAELIGRATGPAGLRAAGGFALARPGLPLAIRVAPLNTTETPIFGPPRLALVCATDLEAELPAPEEELRTLFGLTPAEIRLATAMFDGLSLREAADSFGLSVNTVRFQLARIFDKTGVTRQAELVKLMMRLASSPGPR